MTGFDLSINVIRKFGSLRLSSNDVQLGSLDDGAQFGLAASAVPKELSIEDSDFIARFEGWIVRWKWKSGEPTLTNQVSCYRVRTTVLRGVNLAAKWSLKEFEIVTDSATVCGWLKSILADTHMILEV